MGSVLPFRRQYRYRARRLPFPILVAAVFGGVFTAVFLWDGDLPTGKAATLGDIAGVGAPVSSGTPVAAKFGPCLGGDRFTCVVDGDTIWANGTKIRMADYNTPETSSPGCARERALGDRATGRLTQLLNSGAVTVHGSGTRDTDQYGRALRVVKVDGVSVGETLVAEGLAHEWEGYRRDWC